MVWENMTSLEERTGTSLFIIACEQALRGVLAAWWEKEVELATSSLEFEFRVQFPCGSLSTELSDFRQAARSGNEREYKPTLIDTCQGKWRHYYRHLRQSAFRIDFFSADIEIPETELQAIVPFPAPPPERPGELARKLYFSQRVSSHGTGWKFVRSGDPFTRKHLNCTKI